MWSLIVRLERSPVFVRSGSSLASHPRATVCRKLVVKNR
jgi:hypothetical protein